MVQDIQRRGCLIGWAIRKSNKMAAILSTIGKSNTVGKQNRPLQFEFRMCLVFQPPLYLKVYPHKRGGGHRGQFF